MTTKNIAKWPHRFEQPIAYAPMVELTHNNWIVPQHFLRYQHSLDTVNTVLDNIEFSEHFRVLAAKKDNQVYLQVAVLSPDNYQTTPTDRHAKKLLFGRRWYVEENLPTSELIQTAFLALKIAREHEVRELFQLKHANGVSTPFNNHHDLPLMADNPALLIDTHDNDDIHSMVNRCLFAGAPINLIDRQKIDNDTYLYQVKFTVDDCQLIEFNNNTISFLVTGPSSNDFLHGLMTALVSKSNHYVETHFKYAGFARFSKNTSLAQVGALSIKVRSHNTIKLCSLGKQHANQLNFEIDSSRAPQGCDNAISGFLAAHGVEKPENAHLYTNQFESKISI